MAHPSLPGDEPDVGSFQQGTPGSRWGLGRYLVGRALAADLSAALLALGLLVLAAGVGLYFLLPTWLAVSVGLTAVAILALRAALGAVLRRLTGAEFFGPHERRMRGLVNETRVGVRAELRRLGLPGRRVTMPLLALRLLGHRRAETLRRLRDFDVDRVVPASRLDELHLIVQNVRGTPLPPTG